MSYAAPTTCELGKYFFFPSVPSVIDAHYSLTNVNTTPVVDGSGYYTSPPTVTTLDASSVLAFGNAQVSSIEFDLRIRSDSGVIGYNGTMFFPDTVVYAGMSVAVNIVKTYAGSVLTINSYIRLYSGATQVLNQLIGAQSGTDPYSNTLTFRVKLLRPDIVSTPGNFELYIDGGLIGSYNNSAPYISEALSHKIWYGIVGDWSESAYIKNPYYIGGTGLPSTCSGEPNEIGIAHGHGGWISIFEDESLTGNSPILPQALIVNSDSLKMDKEILIK